MKNQAIIEAVIAQEMFQIYRRTEMQMRAFRLWNPKQWSRLDDDLTAAIDHFRRVNNLTEPNEHCTTLHNP